MLSCVRQDRWAESELFLFCGGDASAGDDSMPSSPPSPTTSADLLAWEQVRRRRCCP